MICGKEPPISEAQLVRNLNANEVNCEGLFGTFEDKWRYLIHFVHFAHTSMSSESSPFFREYSPIKPLTSPFFAEEGAPLSRYKQASTRSPITSTSKPIPKKSKNRQSLPLVYTEFRSPEATNVPRKDTVTETVDRSQAHDRGATMATSQDVVTRHSFVTAIENIGSTAVWVVLLVPTLSAVLMYCLTVQWRYTTIVTPIESGGQLPVAYALPASDYQLSFVRSLLIIDGYQCPRSMCEEYQLTVDTELHSRTFSRGVEPSSQTLLYTAFPLADYVQDFYSPLRNGTISTAQSILIPLPMLHLDTPLVSDTTARYVTFLARYGDQDDDVEPIDWGVSQRQDVSTAIISAANRTTSNSGVVLVSNAEQPQQGNLGTNKAFSGTVNITIFSKAYVIFVALLQLFLSAGTLGCLVHMVRATYNGAKRLQEKFACVQTEKQFESGLEDYGTIESIQQKPPAEQANPEVKIWHFILPEQYTAIAMLFFLCLWQGALPAVCVLLCALGLTLNTTTLFVTGLTVSLAQFGLVFCIVLYINGMKYHNNVQSGRAGSYGTFDYTPTHKKSSARNSYEPFAPQESSPDTYNNDQNVDYWRRSSLGLQGAVHGQYTHIDELTPLEREHRRALSLFVTHHHPCSIEFLGFAYGKLILLFVTWTVVVLYWLLMYPRLWHSKALSDIQVQNVQFRFRVLDVLVLVLTALWVYIVVQVTVATSMRLRRTKLIISRFRQIAFRTLSYQMQLGGFLLLVVSIWYLWTHDFFAGVTFTSYAALAGYVLICCEYYGLLRPMVLSNPALSVHNLELLCFTSAVVLSIAYCMMPPAEEVDPRKLKLQSFVALERNLPSSDANSLDSNNIDSPAARKKVREREILLSKLRQYLLDEDYRRFMGMYLPTALRRRDPQYFCLETALVLLEVSYQTYFSVESKVSSARNSVAPVSLASSTHSATHSAIPSAPDSANQPIRAFSPAETKASSTNPFDDESEEPEEPDNIEGINYGPKLNLKGLGLQFRSFFECEKFTTFGFICESEADGKLIISFRGSLLGNAVANLKFTQVALPSLKRPRSYFTSLLRGTNPALPCLSTTSYGSYKEEPGGAEMEMIAVGDSGDPNTAADDYTYLVDRMESADNEDDENFTPPPTTTVPSLGDTKIGQELKSVGSAIPIINQGFKRVHAGFWESYASIREEYLQAVVLALYEFWQRSLKQAQYAANVSPAHSLGAQAFVTELHRYQQATPSESSLPNTLQALFTSPLSTKNPFSPLFSATAATPAPVPTAVGAGADHMSAGQALRSAIDPASPTPYSTTEADPVAIDVKFCGHSLGAAIASLAAFELAENLKVIIEAFTMEECFNVAKSQGLMKLPSIVACPAPKISLYMFGSPRVGNRQFSTSIARKIDNIYRIQVNGDVVTMMPKFVGFYRHIGTAVIVDEEESGSIIIEPSIIESSILQKSTGSVANHSLDKYRSCLEACFEAADLSEYLSREYRNLSEAADKRSSTGSATHEIPAWMVSKH